jgi:hypothetical protein
VKRGYFEVKQGGVVVASGEGPMEDIGREALHYAMMYGQDGPVDVSVKEIKERNSKKEN